MRTLTVQPSMFEGLYLRVLKPTGAFRADLLAAGFDMNDLQPEYPMEVWIACLDVTARHLHPGVERFAAWRLIGRDFITGFLETIVGRLIAVTFPLLSPKAFIDRGPRFMRMGITDFVSSIEWRGPTHAVLTMKTPYVGGVFLVAGIVEVCLERLHVEPTLVPSQPASGTEVLNISW